MGVFAVELEMPAFFDLGVFRYKNKRNNFELKVKHGQENAK